MPSRWKEVVRLTFKGDRFRDHAFDLTALTELSQFQKLVAETAKTLWRAQHPERERLPRNFEQRTRLCLRKIEEGSAIAPLEVFIEDGEVDGVVQENLAEDLWHEEPPELVEALDLANDVFRALESEEPLPGRFPRSLLPEYQKWGKSLEMGEEIELRRPGKQPARTSQRQLESLSKYADIPQETLVETTAEVIEADVRQRRFQALREDGALVTVHFSEDQETKVTTALKDHKVTRVRFKGSGEVSPDGTSLRVHKVDELNLENPNEIAFDESARSIGDILEEIAEEVPDSEWRKLPPDLSINLDHYLYGVPKE